MGCCWKEDVLVRFLRCSLCEQMPSAQRTEGSHWYGVFDDLPVAPSRKTCTLSVHDISTTSSCFVAPEGFVLDVVSIAQLRNAWSIRRRILLTRELGQLLERCARDNKFVRRGDFR